MGNKLEELEARRGKLLKELSETGDMRQGSVTESYRRCGKATCACATATHPGHGPFYAFTRKVRGKTQTIQLRPGPELTKLLEEVGVYHGFRCACEELIEVNEALCKQRPVADRAASRDRRALKKKLPRSSRRKLRAKSTP